MSDVPLWFSRKEWMVVDGHNDFPWALGLRQYLRSKDGEEPEDSRQLENDPRILEGGNDKMHTDIPR